MKKLIAILLSLTFILSVSVYAATIENSTGTDSRTVTATYQAATDSTVYSIDITWGDMKFNYKEASNGTWNPDTLKYDNPNAEGWVPANPSSDTSLASNEVEIVNRSNANINCGFTFTADESCTEINGVNHSFSLNGNNISSRMIEISAAIPGDENTDGSATTELLALHFSGKPNNAPFENLTVGNITIEIAAE